MTTQHHGHGYSHADGHVAGHEHPTGIRGLVYGLFVPHSHDSSDSIDDALEASTAGIRAVKISLAGLGVTALLQLIVALISGSVALLADTIHNFSDALPLFRSGWRLYSRSGRHRVDTPTVTAGSKTSPDCSSSP